MVGLATALGAGLLIGLLAMSKPPLAAGVTLALPALICRSVKARSKAIAAFTSAGRSRDVCVRCLRMLPIRALSAIRVRIRIVTM